MTEENTQVTKEIMDGLYRIMCNISPSFSGYEVYKEAIPSMTKAYEFIIEHGKTNNVDSRGFDLKPKVFSLKELAEKISKINGAMYLTNLKDDYSFSMHYCSKEDVYDFLRKESFYHQGFGRTEYEYQYYSKNYPNIGLQFDGTYGGLRIYSFNNQTV
jgi:hypothetical protein